MLRLLYFARHFVLNLDACWVRVAETLGVPVNKLGHKYLTILSSSLDLYLGVRAKIHAISA